MQLFVFGVNHRSAPLAFREKLAFPKQTQAFALNDLRQKHIAHEAALISTCNRTELYCTAPQAKEVVGWLANYHSLHVAELNNCLYQKQGMDVAHHAFRVASGLDSMVLGETQIFGQIKESVRIAQHEGALGCLLNGLFQHTFATAKEVRSKTSIGTHSVSIASAAVKITEQSFADISQLKILCVGAGEMSSSLLAHFSALHPAKISLASRDVNRSNLLIHHLGKDIQALSLSEISECLHEYDVLVSSTASTLPIIGKGLVERAIKQRNKPMLIIDLAVPRDVEPEVASLKNILLYSIDDIAGIVDIGRKARQEASKIAEVIIQERCAEFNQWLNRREQTTIIRALRDEAERTRRHTLQNALKKLNRGASAEQALEYLSQQLTNKLMHSPTKVLSESLENKELVETITRLYRLKEPTNGLHELD